MVTCRLQRNTFLPGEQVRGTIRVGVSSEDQESVEIEEVRYRARKGGLVVAVVATAPVALTSSNVFVLRWKSYVPLR